MTMPPRVTRRQALHGLGSLVALPFMESLAAVAQAAPASAKAPKRVAFIYVPNGIHMQDWTPKTEGKLAELPATLAPLEPFKDKLHVLSGLTLDKARANGDGPGDHARAMAAFLTGRQPRKTHGSDIRVGISADQHIATVIGDETRFPSVELGIERGGTSGSCDSGYSCAYQANLSWRGESTPNAKEIDPKAAFDRIFSGNDPKELAEARAKRELYNKSVLDFVMDDAKSLGKQLGQGDQRKLDEYLTAVREVEQRIERAKRANQKPTAKPNVTIAAGIPKAIQEHIRLMCDIMVLAFQTDTTRIATLPFANDGSNHSNYTFMAVPEGHHELSHHQNDAKKQAKLQKINKFHIEQLAYLIGKMKNVKEADGTTLFDNIHLVYGSGIGDGNKHNHDDLPILLLGGGGGGLPTGKHTIYPKDTPLMNLYLNLFERMGAPASSFGDSTGKLKLA